MIARYEPDKQLFYVRADLRNLNCKRFEQNMQFVFDTGASYTVVSLNKLFTPAMKSVVQSLDWDCLQLNSIFIQSFSGGVDKGYKVCLENVRISGLLFQKFYCYVVPDVLSDTAVLGLDFLSCCKFDWRFGENFRFDMDFDRYYKTHDDEGVLSSTHVLLNQLSLV